MTNTKNTNNNSSSVSSSYSSSGPPAQTQPTPLSSSPSPSPSQQTNSVKFHRFTQDQALATFPSLLTPYLPASNAVLQRILSPQNTKERVCLFAATFEPPRARARGDELGRVREGDECEVGDGLETGEGEANGLNVTDGRERSGIDDGNENLGERGGRPNWTILFADRSRPLENNIWVFNPLTFTSSSREVSSTANSNSNSNASTTSTKRKAFFTSLATSIVDFLKVTQIPESSGWPFSNLLKIGGIHGEIVTAVNGIAGVRQVELDRKEVGVSEEEELKNEEEETSGKLNSSSEEKEKKKVGMEKPSDGKVLTYSSLWNCWTIDLEALEEKYTAASVQQQALSSSEIPTPTILPSNLTFTSPVPPSLLHVVISTSSIRRQYDTLVRLPSLALFSSNDNDKQDGDDKTEKEMIAWAFIGIDGGLVTLYVQPQYRGKGYATVVARELLLRLRRGEFESLDKEHNRDNEHDLVSGEEKRNGEKKSQRRSNSYAKGRRYVLAEVGEGNKGSEGVMKALGGVTSWRTGYLGLDISKF